MKIVVNKEAAMKRAKDIVGRIKDVAVETAAKGKVHFLVTLDTGELNGVDLDELRKMVDTEYEGTIKFYRKLNSGDSYMCLEIVDPK